MSTPLIIFKHINDHTQMTNLFSELTNSKGIVFIKDHDQVVMEIQASKFGEHTLTCQLDPSHTGHSDFNKTYCANFYLGGDTYYFEASGVHDGLNLKLQIRHLFYLQKRRNVRYEVPEGENINLHLEIDGRKLAFRVKDLSTEGLRVQAINIQIPYKSGDKIEGELFYNGLTVPLQARVKSFYAKNGETLFGLQLLSLENATELFLIDRISDLQRKSYLNKKTA